MRRLCAAVLSVVLAFGWAFTAPIPSAQAAAPAAPKAAPGHPVRSTTFTITGALGTKVARTAELQRKSGSRWVRVAVTKTSRSGRYSFRLTAAAPATVLRVYAAKTKVGKKTYPRLTTKVATVMAVTVTPISPMAGERVTISDTLGKKGARPATLQRLAGKRWVNVQSVRTSSSGAATFTTALSGTSTFRVYAPPTKIKKKKAPKITLAAFSVAASAQAGDIAVPATSTINQALATAAHFSPARAGRGVELQRLNGSTWTTVATGTQDATGTAILTTTPTATGSAQYRAVAAAFNGAPAFATSAGTTTIGSGIPKPSIVIGGLNDAVTGVSYQTTLTVGGGTAPFSWTATGLPEGMQISTDGTLSGTPTTPGTYDVHLKVTDAEGRSAETTVSIVVQPPLSIDFDALPDGIAGESYQTWLEGAGGAGPYTWVATGLPTGLSLASDGTLSGTTDAVGTHQVELTVTDTNHDTATKTVSLRVLAALELTTTTLPHATVGAAYETTVAATGGLSPYEWSAKDLPSWLHLNASTGALTGTPTASGSFDFTITARDDNGSTTSRGFSLEVAAAFSITTASLPGGVVDTAYPETTLATEAGTGPYTWRSTTLPAGLSLSSTGVITGTPTTAGVYDAVKITVTDADGKTAETTFSVTIVPAVHITTATLPNGVAGTDYPATTLAAADGNGTDYAWTSTTLPAGLSLSNTGVITGTPTTAGVYDAVKITVTDHQGKTSEATFTVTIAQAVHITTTSLPNGIAGTDYPETTVAAADGNPGYTWASDTLPGGLRINPNTGVITGTPTSAGVYDTVKITVTDHQGKTAEATFTVTIAQAVHITTASLPNGVVGTTYPATTLAAADGNPGYTWEQAGLPAGLHLDSATGVITGTPTTAGVYDTVKITVTDHKGKTAEATFTIAIVAGIHITTTNLPDGIVGTGYPETTLAAADGNPGYTWRSTTLPAGLSLSSTGVITGTPTTAGVYDAVKITVTDADGKTSEATFTLKIVPAVHVTTTSLPSGVVGTSYTATTLAAADGNPGYTWASTTLPAGLSLSNTGVITGTPTTAGVYDAVKITVTDKDGKTAEATFTVTIAQAVHITTTSLPNGIAGTDYPETTVSAADGNPGYTWASDTLPGGLRINPDTGVITGTPTSAGVYDAVKITVTDHQGTRAEATFTVTITQAVHVTTATLPNGVVGTSYPETTLAAADGNGTDYAWTSTTLPAGLSLSNTGVITGTPTTAGVYDAVKITVTDHKGKFSTATFSMTIAPAVHVTTDSLPNGVVGTSYTATMQAADGNPGYTWASTTLPAGLSLSNTGVITGTPTTARVYDAVKITVTDHQGKTAEATFSVTIVPAVHITTTNLPNGVAGTDYPATTLAATDGNPGYTWRSTTLPDGLSINTNTGAITGTPTTARVYDAVKITVTDADGKTAEATFTITIVPAVHITTTSLPGGVVGTSYPETTLAAADGNPGYTWRSTTLPDGLSINTNTGAITGTPTTAGTFNAVKIIATDASGKTTETTYTVTITPAVHITTTSLPDAVLNESYPSTTLAAADGTGPYRWSATGLPSGMEINSTSGALTGTPTESGTFAAVKITATDANDKATAKTFTFTIHPVMAISTTSLDEGVVDEAYSATLSGLGGIAPHEWALTGLPAGLSLNTGTGEITGSPTESGTFDLVATLSDTNDRTATRDLSLTIRPVVNITTATLPAGVAGTSYSTSLAAAGGTTDYTWTSTTLPDGLALTSAGVLSGTPTAAGTTNVTFTVADAHTKTASVELSIKVAPAVHITTTALPAGVVGTSYSTSLIAADGNGTNYSWTSTALPAGLELSTTGKLTGTPTADGTTTVTFTAADNQGKTATAELSITIAKAVHITTTTLPGGIVGTSYPDTQLAAADGNGTDYSWTSTALPAGLELSTTGKLTGTPTVDGTTTVTFTAADNQGKTATAELSITIGKAVHITTTSLPSVEARDAYPETTLAAADGNSASYTWSSTALPAGLTLSEAGVLSGTPTTDGTTAVTFTVTDAGGATGTAELSITITAAVHLSSTLSIGVVGGDYTSALTASGGTAPYTISATSLPEGLTFSNGTISGTPTTAGTNTPVEITVTDSRGKSSTTTPGLTVVKAVPQAAGMTQTCAITPSGGVECWGGNINGQLGDGTTTSSTYPVAVTGLTGKAISLSGGTNSTCALLSDGTVDCWGDNSSGQLGVGDTNAHTAAQRVADIDSATTISAGQGFACATLSQGTATCWGQGTIGQLGNGAQVNASTPVPVRNLTGVMAIDTGATHACALTTSGAVSCWGRNINRQLGAGMSNQGVSSIPVKVPDIAPATSLSTHLATHSCVTTTIGTVQCWGNNNAYQLGVTTSGNSIAAVTAAGVTDAAAVVVGASHSCAITTTGAMRCWGSSGSGRLGDGNPVGTTNVATAVSVALGGTAASASAGYNHTCATLSTGTLQCWGANTYGQLATGFNSIIASPMTMTAISNKYAALTLGNDFACGLTHTGGVECWGNNFYGQLGNGTTLSSSSAVQVTGLTSGVTAIDAGVNHACALTADGGVSCWGNNTDGKLGNSSTTNSSTPVAVTDLSSGATGISAGGVSTCAVMATGTVKCWGNGSYGTLGNGSPAASSIPVNVSSITSATAVSVGTYHACATGPTMAVQCWGNGSALGRGQIPTSAYPGNVNNLHTGAAGLSAGNNSSCILDQGQLMCWGDNGYGQIGDGTTTTATTATAVNGLSSGVASVAVGDSHTCAVTTSGTVKCWGGNSVSQLGGGTSLVNSTAPVDVPGLSDVSSLVVANNSTCAILTDGSVKCWGSNAGNQLGISTAFTSTPTAPVGFNVAAVSADAGTLGGGAVGTTYADHQLTATGGVAPYTWTSTDLPAGLTLSSAGVLSGTPTEAGTTEVTFTVTDVRGKTATTTASLTVVPAVHITTDATLPGGVVGTAYSTQLAAADGTSPYTWSSDVVPAGLTLSQDGLLSGTPTAATASTTMQITATDHNGKTDTKAVTIVITPVIHGAAALSVGYSSTCAVTEAGGVECWGDNTFGELGNGATTASTIPVQVSGLSSGVRSVAVGASHACALTDAGGVKCWGTNQIGQLGNGGTTGTHEDGTAYISTTPVDVVGLTSGVKAIGAGSNHTCAVTNVGAVECWGYNTTGQLGDGSTMDRNVPVQVISSGVVAVTGGNASTCALTDAGGVKCWGSNNKGQIGIDTSTTVQLTPVDVPGLTSGVTSLSVGGRTACAVMTDGGLKCWGNNANGQLGSDLVTSTSTPTDVPGVAGPKQVAAATTHACVLTTTGGVLCWGDNTYGQLGDGKTTSRSTPATVEGLSSGVVAVSTNLNRSCALLDNGSVKCWGSNDVGQLGDGSLTDSHTPADVFGYGSVPLHIATSGLPTGEVGAAYPATKINLSGGTAPYTWSASGLPDGLSINTSTGVISGTPLTATVATVSVAANDAGGNIVSTNLSLTIVPAVHITTTTLPNGLVGASYQDTTLAATDGAAPYGWSATGLPAGLSLDTNTGTITGTPTAYGVFSVAITATDHDGYTATTTVPLSVLAIAGATDDVLSLHSAQSNFTCEVTNVGRVKCWGQNAYGQIGDGTTTNALSAKVVDSIGTGVKDVATGLHFACAITSTGGVKCWGYNASGQLGNGSTTDSLTPVEVTDGTTPLTGITSLAAGANHACAVTDAGGVKCWGSGTSGELGNGAFVNSSVAVDVKDLAGTSTLTGVTAVSGGTAHSCALMSTGTVNCWGANNFTQLGNSVGGSSSIPTAVSDLSSVRQISSNQYINCAATTDGAAKCWGRNNAGQLGVTGLTTSTPVAPTGLTTTGVISVATGVGHSCALTTDGTMCWGANSSGQLGDGTRINHTEPASASQVTDSLIAITAGGANTCGLTASREVECWGANVVGQLGNGISASVTSPLEATNVSSSASVVSAGYYSTCAITTSGSVQCWGNNSAGELGDGTTTANATPVTVQDSTSSALVGVTALANSRGGQFSCALTASGAVYCWGVNNYGQLGRGTETVANTTASSVAAQVTGLASGVTAISTGPSAACAVTQAGTVKCWGYNNYGQLGDSTTTAKSYPVDVSGLDHVTAVSMGTTHACALIDDGSVKCWGNNSYGQLGDNTTTIRPNPVLVQELSGATAISSGADYTCAIANNALKCWGYNLYGQLGNGTTNNELLPADVTGLASGVSAITTGTTHACALTTDGTVKCWGRNLHGELGVGDLLDRTTPTIVTEAAPATGISAGETHTCLVTTTGALQCWGYNTYNELGKITATFTTPQTVLGIRD